MSEPVKPPESPAWDTTQANYIAPDSPHVNNGVAFNEIPPSNVFNGWMNIIYRFVNWLTAGAQIIPGGAAPTVLTITSNGITPTAGVHYLSAGGTINLISTANHNPGRLLRLHGTTSQTTVLGNLTGAAAGFAQMQTSDGDSITLLTEQDIVEFRLNAAGNLWRECFRSASLTGSATAGFGARLTLATGTPITTADQTAKTTVYLTPYEGGSIPIWDGVRFVNTPLTEVSIAVPASTSQAYDIFVYLNAGVVTLEAVAWTNDTTRATALVLQNGAYVKTGATTHMYVGSFRTTTVSGQTEDSAAKRLLFNYYNRTDKNFRKAYVDDTWSYNTNTVRQANAKTGNQVAVMVGVSEDAATFSVCNQALNTGGAASQIGAVGLGVDSTTVSSATQSSTPIGVASTPSSTFYGYLTAGYHFIAALECAGFVGGTTTWGAGGATGAQSMAVGIDASGITGSLRM